MIWQREFTFLTQFRSFADGYDIRMLLGATMRFFKVETVVDYFVSCSLESEWQIFKR